MIVLFFILVVVASVLVSFIILVQNPKGGGLSGSIAGFSSQFMGVKQTTDVLEKGTWVIAIIIAVLSITSTIFFSGVKSDETPVLRPTQSGTETPALPSEGAAPSIPFPGTENPE